MKIDRKKKIICIGIISAIAITQIAVLIPLIVDLSSSKRNEILVNYADSLYFGSDYAIEGANYQVDVNLGSGYVNMYSGITGADGIIIFVPHDDFESGVDSYRITFSGGLFHNAIPSIIFDDLSIPTEVEATIKSITTTVIFSDLTIASGYALDIYFDSVYLGTVSTDEFGVAVFEGLIVGNYAFTSDLYNATDILGTTISVSIDITIPRDLLYYYWENLGFLCYTNSI